MKRVFAFISLFAIALVMFGFGTSNVKAADQPAAGKWFENPYLLTDDEGNVVEIPMYIMNSIKTTFPDYFDYEGAKGTEFEDKNWVVLLDNMHGTVLKLLSLNSTLKALLENTMVFILKVLIKVDKLVLVV